MEKNHSIIQLNKIDGFNISLLEFYSWQCDKSFETAFEPPCWKVTFWVNMTDQLNEPKNVQCLFDA